MVQRFIDTVGEAFKKLDGQTDDISVVEGPTEDATQYVVTISVGAVDRSRDLEMFPVDHIEEGVFSD
jgi:hypothetical protein